MPVNVNDPEYVKAEKEYHEADSLEERLSALRKMISHAPKHKGGENLRQQLTSRRKKLEQEITKKKKSGKPTKIGIKKEDMQAVIIGYENSGKSSIIKNLTNAEPTISEIPFSTTTPLVGMMPYASVQIQLIDVPAIESEYYDKGLANNADTILIVVNSLEEIEKTNKEIKNKAKKIIVYNKSDTLSENEKRKISANLSSKKYNFVLFSSKTLEGLEELKEKIFRSFNKIRVFTKEPGKEKTKKPTILEPNQTVRDVAEKILKGFSKTVKETKIWGPSSKFPGQKVGLKHKLKDKDVVEFKTK